MTRETEVIAGNYRFMQKPEGAYRRKLEVYDLFASNSGEEPIIVLVGGDVDKLQMWMEGL